MSEKNLLSSNFELYQKFLGLQNEAVQLSLLVNRLREFESISEEMNLLILENYQELYSVFSRSIRNEAILCLCRLLDKSKNGYGLEKLENRLVVYVNKLNKRSIHLYDGTDHDSFLKRLNHVFQKAVTLSGKLRDRRDNYIAHNSSRKIQGIGVSQAPTPDSVDEFIKSYKPQVTFEEIEKSAAAIFDYFKVCNAAFFDVDLIIEEVISDGDFRSLLFSLKALAVWEEIHEKDYETRGKVRDAMRGWSPFRGSNSFPQ